MNDKPWYIRSFQEDYLKIYAHRTDEAAREEIDHIIQQLQLINGQHILDLCCGNGRHSRQLARQGFVVTAVDLSDVLLAEARRLTEDNLSVEYVQCDVRDIAYEQEFDAVLNLFTSFGYFEEVDENQRVLERIKQALKPGGRFVVDFLNPSFVKRSLVPYSERKQNGLIIKETRTIEEPFVRKWIEVEEDKQIRTYEERVRLFSEADMKHMMEKVGLHIEGVFGSFAFEPFSSDQSSRMIITGHQQL